MNPKKMLLQVLDIIDYKDNKDEYVEKFIKLCEQRAILLLLENLSDDKQKSLTEEIKNFKTSKEVQTILKKYFSSKEILISTQKSSEEIFEEILKTVIPTLDKNQKLQLQQYIASLKKDLQQFSQSTSSQ